MLDAIAVRAGGTVAAVLIPNPEQAGLPVGLAEVLVDEVAVVIDDAHDYTASATHMGAGGHLGRLSLRFGRRVGEHRLHGLSRLQAFDVRLVANPLDPRHRNSSGDNRAGAVCLPNDGGVANLAEAHPGIGVRHARNHRRLILGSGRRRRFGDAASHARDKQLKARIHVGPRRRWRLFRRRKVDSSRHYKYSLIDCEAVFRTAVVEPNGENEMIELQAKSAKNSQNWRPLPWFRAPLRGRHDMLRTTFEFVSWNRRKEVEFVPCAGVRWPTQHLCEVSRAKAEELWTRARIATIAKRARSPSIKKCGTAENVAVAREAGGAYP
jgi:hypothetical protein